MPELKLKWNKKNTFQPPKRICDPFDHTLLIWFPGRKNRNQKKRNLQSKQKISILLYNLCESKYVKCLNDRLHRAIRNVKWRSISGFRLFEVRKCNFKFQGGDGMGGGPEDIGDGS